MRDGHEVKIRGRHSRFRSITFQIQSGVSEAKFFKLIMHFVSTDPFKKTLHA